jgi:hypothetical protein
MAKQTINIGSTANDGTGDPLRTAFNKANENFTEVYDIANSAFAQANTGSENPFDQDLNTSNNVSFNQITVSSGNTIFNDGDEDVGKIIPTVTDGSGLQIEAQVDFEIKVTQGTGEEEETAIWSFEPDGRIVFPDSTIQTTAYTGGNPFDQDLNTSNNVTFNEVSVNDDLTISGSIVSNSSFTVTSEIGATSSGVFLDGANDVILFATNNAIIRSDNDGTFKDLIFSANGNLEAPGTISANTVNASSSFGLPVYATEAARDSAITSPQPGMMVYVSSGEGAGLQVRGATQWNPVGGLTGE